MLLISSCLSHARGEGANGNTLSNIQRKAVVHTMYEYKDDMHLPFENIESVAILGFPEGYSKTIFYQHNGEMTDNEITDRTTFVIIGYVNQNGKYGCYICFCRNLNYFADATLGEYTRNYIEALLMAPCAPFASTNWMSNLLNHIVTYNTNDYTELHITPQAARNIYGAYCFEDDSFDNSLQGDEIIAKTMECELCGKKQLCIQTTRLGLSFWVCSSCREWMLAE